MKIPQTTVQLTGYSAGYFRSGIVNLFCTLLLAGGLVLPLEKAAAVPACPDPLEQKQPNGAKIRMHLRGDEYFSWKESEEGHAVVKDTDGFWKYARPVAGKAEYRAIAGARVGVANPAALGLRKHQLPDAAALRAHIKQRHEAIHGKSTGLQQSATGTKSSSPQASPSQAAVSQAPGGAPLPVPVVGTRTIKNLVILACFSDHWDSVNNTVLPGYGRVDISEYTNLYNQSGYTADGASGSVQDYYKEVSYGKLTIESTVTVWVCLPHDHVYYGAGVHGGSPGLVAADAVEAAAAAGVDFSQFDSDGDGWVDCLDVLHSGYGEEATGDANDVWSVKGSMSSTVTKNSVKIYNYHTEPALRGVSGSSIERIGTICHETGHFFGLPDLYDYSDLTDGLGNWCLMSGASWNGSSGSQPGHFSAWCKVFLGFARTVQVHSKLGLSLPRVEDNAVVGMLRDGMSNDQYFLIENRAKVGFDSSTKINPGLLIYHVDQTNANNDLGTWPHPAVKIEEADGNDSIGVGGGGSQAGDAWTSTSGLAGGFRDQTGNPTTNAMLYQAPVSGTYSYSRTDTPASYSYNRISNFSAAGSTMTCDVASSKTDAPTQAALPTSFTVAWAPSTLATKYEIQEGCATTLTSFFDGAENADDLQDNWYVAGKTMRTTDGHNFGSYSYQLLRANYGAIESLTLRKPFKVTASSVISFYLMSHVSAGNGYLKCEISNDNSATWKTLGTYSGKIDPWSQCSFDFTALGAKGISSGDLCMLRFVMDSEYGSGYSGFPSFSYALDDISLTGVEIAGYGGWTTLSNNVTGTSYSIPAKPAGSYAYRVQPYSSGTWQGYGAVGETTVGANHAPVFNGSPVTGADAYVGTGYTGSVGSLVTDLDINDVLTFSKLSGPDWVTVAANGTFSGSPLPGDVGSATFTVRVTDIAGASADMQVNVTVRPPTTALSTGLVAYLPFDNDFLDYSGHGNHPTQSGTNVRAVGNIGSSGYVLNSTGYLSFGMNSDLHFPNTTAGNSTSFTVSFWAKIPTGSYTGAPAFVSNKDWSSDTNPGWGLSTGPGTASSGYFQMNFKEGNANSRDYDWITAPGTGWHHYVAVFQRSGTRTCITYVDGVQANSQTMFASGTNIEVAGLPLNLGQEGTGTGTRGTWAGAQMDDFAFWRVALSSTDVAAIYQSGLNGYGMAYAEAAPVITTLSSSPSLSVGGTLSLAVSAYSASPVAYQWYCNGVPITGGTTATYSKSGITLADLGNYNVVVSSTNGTAGSSEILVNGLPGATDMIVIQRVGTPLQIALADLATHWSDPDGNSIQMTRFDATTSLGGTLTPINVTTASDGSFVISPDAFLAYSHTADVNDTFTYTIRDNAGGSAEGRVFIRSTSDPLNPKPLAVTSIGGGPATVSFLGIPGYSYSIERSTDLVHWHSIHTTTAPQGGTFSCMDDFSDLGGISPRAAFYRMTWTP